MPSLFRAVLMFLALLSVAACTSKPLVTPDRTVPADLHADYEKTKQAILTTLVKRKWEVQRISPDLIQAQITVRGQFHAEIDIPYSADHYQIKYRDSRELNYKDGKIHKNYNRWVRLLDKGILRELRDDQAKATARSLANGAAQSVPQAVQ
jgi:predicted small lipoprotein YifL